MISSLALIAGATPAESRALIGCPARDSLAVAAGGHTLRVRPEQPRGGTVLIHLCADPAAGPVTRWDVRTGAAEPTRLPVQAVSHQHALTATTTATGRAARLRVEVESASGERRRFTLAVPLPGPPPDAGEP